MKKAKKVNEFTAVFAAKSVNEGFARGVVASFAAAYDPTVEELCDMRTAVSEAVTNGIVHAYRDETDERKKKITLKAAYYEDGLLCVSVKDRGCGIEDVSKARQPMYSGTVDEERSGMGFSIMESFMDKLRVRSEPGKGTTVVMQRAIRLRVGKR